MGSKKGLIVLCSSLCSEKSQLSYIILCEPIDQAEVRWTSSKKGQVIGLSNLKWRYKYVLLALT